MKEEKRHLSKVFWIVLVLVVLAAIIIGYYCQKNRQIGENNATLAGECNYDSDCVPDSCCHSKACVSIINKPKCSGVLCSMECAPGTLDCGQGSCKCSDGKCKAIIS